jgi:protein subunit release factor A
LHHPSTGQFRDHFTNLPRQDAYPRIPVTLDCTLNRFRSSGASGAALALSDLAVRLVMDPAGIVEP